MEAVFTTVMTGFTLPLQDSSTYLQQVASLKRIGALTWNSEYLPGRTPTDPGRLVIRYPPITVSYKFAPAEEDTHTASITKQLPVTRSRVGGVTVQLTPNGVVSVVCAHTEPDAARTVTEAIRQDLIETLRGLGPCAFADSADDLALTKYALCEGVSDALSAAGYSAKSALTGSASASEAVSLRSFMAVLYPIGDELRRLRRRLIMGPRLDVHAEEPQAERNGLQKEVNDTVLDTFHDRVKRRREDDGAGLADQERSQRGSGSVRRPGHVRLNVRGDAGLEWLERLVHVNGNGDGGDIAGGTRQESDRVAELCTHRALAVPFPSSGAREASCLSEYLLARRERVRDRLVSARVHHIVNRGGIQLALQWRPHPALSVVEMGEMRRVRLCSQAGSSAGPVSAVVTDTHASASPIAEASHTSAPFFFMESTQAPYIQNESPLLNSSSASSLPKHGELLKHVDAAESSGGTVSSVLNEDDSLAVHLRAARLLQPAASSQSKETASTAPPQASSTATEVQHARVESVNCIIFASGKAQLTAQSVEAMHEVVRLIILPFLLCVGELTA